MSTLPEALVASIKKVSESVQAFRHEVDKFHELGSRLQVEVDQLISRPKERLENIPTDLQRPVRLPRIIEPVMDQLKEEAAE